MSWSNNLKCKRYIHKCAISYTLIHGMVRNTKNQYLKNETETFYQIYKFITCATD